MKLFRFIIFIGQTLIILSCNEKIIPDKPFLTQTNFAYDTLPLSELNIPVRVNLKPLYLLAEKSVDTFFSSPNFPDDWVSDNCDTRYKYQFRRGPLEFFSAGSVFKIGFTGYYKIIGSTRVCAGNTVITPWTPPCRCGYDEGERKVWVTFSSTLNISPDYKAKLNIVREEPVALDKCSVCFLGIDITNQVMNGLKKELDISKKQMEESLGIIDLRTQMQDLWNRVEQPYDIYSMGWLQVNPENIAIQEISTRRDSLFLLFSITARPSVQMNRPRQTKTLLPLLRQTTPVKGFNIFLDAVLNYDSLSSILTNQFAVQEFEFRKGKTKKTVIIKSCRIYGEGNEQVILKLDFTGTHSGLIYLTGKPAYDPVNKTFYIKDIDFDVKTKNFLLANADWLFNKRISSRLESATRFDLKPYADAASAKIEDYLNRNWENGISSTGKINELNIVSFYPLNGNLVIRSQASGDFSIQINDPLSAVK